MVFQVLVFWRLWAGRRVLLQPADQVFAPDQSLGVYVQAYGTAEDTERVRRRRTETEHGEKE